MLAAEHFVGRAEELDRIDEGLRNDGSRKIVVVHGLGGMGKTQLALAYARQHKTKYSAVFWVNVKDVDTLKQGYTAAAKRILQDHPSLVHLKIAVESGNLDEATEAVKRWLSDTGNKGWLMIYDNYDTPELPGCNDAKAFNIRPFFPQSDHGAIIITTRSSQLRLGHVISLKKLQNVEHSLEILSHASGRSGLINGRPSAPVADIANCTSRSRCSRTGPEIGWSATCSCHSRCLSLSNVDEPCGVYPAV